jgi:hypothetical protein
MICICKIWQSSFGGQRNIAGEYFSTPFIDADLAKQIIVIIHFSHQYLDDENKRKRDSSNACADPNRGSQRLGFE